MKAQQLPQFRYAMSIEEIGHEGNRYIDSIWYSLYESMYEELTNAFREMEDAAYGMYLDRLMTPLFECLEEAGFVAMEPVEKNDFIIGRCLLFRNSLEKWGSENNRSRIFWNVVRRTDGDIVGTLLTEIPHSHLKFHIPSAPVFYTLRECDRGRIMQGIRQIKK
ncbi:hypothetical protein HN020_08820 [Brevibacillus borstelensis]|jgi:hypothetical protein|uniref:DUF6022 family protein n=1 Tax=Brevibacillus borstelensis TaxID=45462 RepID=UPI00148FF7D5|nr:DUF6022 family protein [Brevibacillus borstelensis]NOU54849.1 hypothetical protein [Brevibacillus borstelensis]